MTKRDGDRLRSMYVDLELMAAEYAPESEVAQGIVKVQSALAAALGGLPFEVMANDYEVLHRAKELVLKKGMDQRRLASLYLPVPK